MRLMDLGEGGGVRQTLPIFPRHFVWNYLKGNLYTTYINLQVTVMGNSIWLTLHLRDFFETTALQLLNVYHHFFLKTTDCTVASILWKSPMNCDLQYTCLPKMVFTVNNCDWRYTRWTKTFITHVLHVSKFVFQT